MGIFDGILGPKHPPLPESDPAVLRLGDEGDALESFVAKANDAIEIVVGQGPLYVFVGKPPKAFGVLWFEEGERFDVRSLIGAGVLTPQAAAKLVSDFTRIYGEHASAQRFSYRLANRKVTITPSDAFHAQVHQAVEQAREG